MFPFQQLVIAHVITGSVGLITLWIPILGRKGSALHKRWGKIFAVSLVLTGILAVGISICTLIAPLETHPFSDDAALIRGLFGWMMFYLAILTITLSLYGRWCVQNRLQHAKNKTALNLFLQALMFGTAVNCAIYGWSLAQPVMIGIATIGIAAGILNTRFILTKTPAHKEWLVQHTRGLVGAGISVYTAFLAFGAVNLMPQMAFSPVVWATPCTLGVTYLLYHQYRIMMERKRRPATRTAAAKPTLTISS